MHETGLRLDQIVKGRVVFFSTNISEAWNWAVHKGWIVFLQSFIVNLKSLCNTWYKIFHNRMRFSHDAV